MTPLANFTKKTNDSSNITSSHHLRTPWTQSVMVSGDQLGFIKLWVPATQCLTIFGGAVLGGSSQLVIKVRRAIQN